MSNDPDPFDLVEVHHDEIASTGGPVIFQHFLEHMQAKGWRLGPKPEPKPPLPPSKPGAPPA